MSGTRLESTVIYHIFLLLKNSQKNKQGNRNQWRPAPFLSIYYFWSFNKRLLHYSRHAWLIYTPTGYTRGFTLKIIKRDSQWFPESSLWHTVLVFCFPQIADHFFFSFVLFCFFLAFQKDRICLSMQRSLILLGLSFYIFI